MSNHTIAWALAVCLVSTFSTAAAGFSLSNKATDESVCDLSPRTTEKLLSHTFVEAGTKDSLQIYSRLALRQITQNCKNGQVLILDSDDGHPRDASYFQDTANHVCAVAEIKRISTGTSEYPQAFQMKCTILKIQEAQAWLTKVESEKSTETMITEGTPQRAKNTSPGTQSSPNSNCDKMTLSSVFFGGGGCKEQ